MLEQHLDESSLFLSVDIFLVVRFLRDARIENFFKFFHTKSIQVFGFK